MRIFSFRCVSVGSRSIEEERSAPAENRSSGTVEEKQSSLAENLSGTAEEEQSSLAESRSSTAVAEDQSTAILIKAAPVVSVEPPRSCQVAMVGRESKKRRGWRNARRLKRILCSPHLWYRIYGRVNQTHPPVVSPFAFMIRRCRAEIMKSIERANQKMRKTDVPSVNSDKLCLISNTTRPVAQKVPLRRRSKANKVLQVKQENIKVHKLPKRPKHSNRMHKTTPISKQTKHSNRKTKDAKRTVTFKLSLNETRFIEPVGLGLNVKAAKLKEQRERGYTVRTKQIKARTITRLIMLKQRARDDATQPPAKKTAEVPRFMRSTSSSQRQRSSRP